MLEDILDQPRGFFLELWFVHPHLFVLARSMLLRAPGAILFAPIARNAAGVLQLADSGAQPARETDR